ncbi:hypothetical protein [Luteitalea sp.]|uniref:hypothetical protein n=1 Tax=Luteitalea sp. TaxID=2004800 RepID=UPI0025C47146|nr:hypothetical protein [Luteitalea sp.]
MKRRLDAGAGYVIVDHTNSPGLSAADVAHVPGQVAIPGGTVFERDMLSCSHCQATVLLNPARVRDRAVCPKCHAYICDRCETARVAAGGACVPFEAVLDRAGELLVKHAGQIDHPELDVLNDPTRLAYTDAPRIVVPGGAA